MSSRPRPTRDQLKAMSEHLVYEFGMLDSVARALALGLCDGGPLNNALLESFCIHTRVLLDFFFPSAPRGGDLVASDYFDNENEWAIVRGELPTELVNVRRRVGKEVAHLTLERLNVTPEEKPWNFAAIAAAISGVLEKFTSAVDPELLIDEAKRPDDSAA